MQEANVPILYPLKTPGNQRLSCVFWGYRRETLARNVLVRPGQLHKSKTLFEVFGGGQLVINVATLLLK